jgi:pilus assembly protein Flp/PilA
MHTFRKLLRDEAGATAIEYGLLAAFVGVALVTAMQGLGNSLNNTYNTVSNKMANANTTAA